MAARNMTPSRFHDKEYVNWLKAGQALLCTAEGLYSFCENPLSKYHQQLKSAHRQKKCNGPCGDTPCKNCEDWRLDWHNDIKSHLVTPGGMLCWANANEATWHDKYWEVAKTYMGSGKDESCEGPATTDPIGLLQLIINCNLFDLLITADRQSVKDVRTIRNNLFHSANFKMSKHDLRSHIDTMVKLLEDPVHLIHDTAAKDAVRTLKTILKADINTVIGEYTERNLWKMKFEGLLTQQSVTRKEVDKLVKFVRRHEELMSSFDIDRLKAHMENLERRITVVEDEQQETNVRVQQVEDEVAAQRAAKVEAAKGPPGIENIGDRLKEVLQERHSDMRLSNEESAPLDEVYVELRLQHYEDENLPETLTERDVVLMEERMQRSPVVELPELFDKLRDQVAPKKVVPVALKKVLIRGKAGVGKTTFVRRIASQWAAGELWKDVFSHVFVITLRELCQDKDWTLKELLLGGLSPDEKDAAFGFICRNASRILILADGLDEIRNFVYSQSHCRPDHNAPIDLSLLLSSIIGNSMLPGASVVVTSRPTLQLPMKAFERTVEVYGFPRECIVKYVSQFCANEEVKLFIMKTFKDNQSLLTLCYIPLHCRFVCHALADMYAQDTNGVVPAITTTTQLYVNATTNSAKSLHPRLKGMDADEDDVLQVIKGLFTKYADLAKQCVMKVPLRIIFYTNDLTAVGLLQDDADDMQCGVMTQSRTMGKSVRTIHKRCWSFNHLTLQEYFSAIGLLQGADDDDIWQLLQDESSIRRHEVVISFILGLSADKQNEDYVHQLLSSELTLNPRELVSKLAVVLADDPLKVVTILHESQDPNLVDVIAAEVSSKKVFPTEIRALSWVLKQAQCPVTTLNLDGCQLHIDLVKLLCEGLKQNKSVQSLSLSYNGVFAKEEAGRTLGAALASMEQLGELSVVRCDLSKESLRHVLDGLERCPRLTSLDLSRNRVFAKEEAGRTLGAALASMEQLGELSVVRCDLSKESLRHVLDGLERCPRLTSLRLGLNRVFAEEEAGRTLGAALASMEQLGELSVSGCLSKESLPHVLDGLERCPRLTSLDLGSNYVFEEEEAGRLLGDALAEMTQIRRLHLYCCFLTDSSFQHIVDGICRGPGCQQLVTLNCQSNYELTSAGGSEETVRRLLTKLPHLRILTFDCRLSDESETRLKKEFPGRFH